MNTPATESLMQLHLHARNWRELISSINEALFEAQHCSAGLRGGSPQLLLLLSRQLLDTRSPEARRHLCSISTRLQAQGVAHSICQTPDGVDQPPWHLLRINFPVHGTQPPALDAVGGRRSAQFEDPHF